MLLNAGLAADVPAAEACAAFGFEAAPADRVPAVYDAVLFTNEFDLLELRLHELADVVTRFIIVEGDATFSGHPKERALHNVVADLAAGGDGHAHAQGRDMRWLQPFLPRIQLTAVDALAALTATGAPSANPWEIESMHRKAFAGALAAVGARIGDLAIVADLDELPRAAAVRILRDCAVPAAWFPVRLEMRFYYYSFEWTVPGAPWLVASVNRIREETGRLWFTRSNRPEQSVFYDAGWHCSWCFPRLSDFVTKMSSYAHTEHDQPEFRDFRRIQRYICDGSDLFDRLPEGFTVAEVLRQGDGRFVRQTSLVGAPDYLARNGPARFAHLLPGHCRRPDAPPT